MADEYIKRQALLDAYDAAHKGPPGGARKLIQEGGLFDCGYFNAEKCPNYKDRRAGDTT